MTLEEAIQIVTEILEDEESMWEIDGSNALKLGIEALRRVRIYRKVVARPLNFLLPGETKE